MSKKFRGQMHVWNLMDLFYVSIFYAVAVFPILTVLVNSLVLWLQVHPGAYTDALIFLIQLVPIGLGLSILGLIWFFAIPHQESRI